MGARPPRAAVRAAVRACLADLEPGERIVVALSGGPDSLALTEAATVVSAELGLLCEAVVVDHGLQPGSDEVASRAAGQARVLGCTEVRVVTAQVDTGPGAGGLEAAARTARYRALEAVAAGVPPSGLPGDPAVQGLSGDPVQGASGDPAVQGISGDSVPGAPGGPPAVPRAAAVLLGHTRDDQAETVLLGLARGSGTRSLAGMAARSALYRRPLLDVPRQVVLAAAGASATADPRLEPWTDPHNADRGFARVRVRRDVLPLLESALGPGVAEALARTAKLARQDADALDMWADRVWEEIGGAAGTLRDEPRVAVLALDGALTREPVLPVAVLARVVRRFLVAAGCPGGELSAAHVDRVTALVAAPGSRSEVALPGGRRARREAGALVVRD